MSDSTFKYNLLGYEVYQAEADITSSGAGTLVGTASVPSNKIPRVVAAHVQFGTGTSFKFVDQNGTLMGATYYDPVCQDLNHAGWFEADNAGEAIVGTVDGAAAGVTINYILVDTGA